MSSSAFALAASALALVLLSFVVGARLLYCRVREMRGKRIHPQAAATSLQVAARLEDVRAADNFRNLFEVPVLFYALVATALASGHVPAWLVVGCWSFVALRVVHSAIHCTYNKVFHRLTAFLAGFGLIVVLWVAFILSLPARNAA
ncbi:MAG: MAPEG family protein [Candidatus Accumulibacter sp.]|uniref:MAPEG family protein n=1 Tax=Accumulibacter sp. TaxID=2053492 RepID=UPI00287A945A|nr:MAPEG family protein [Accumulibacter sp.]MDS4015340.1 MAPEG family protein [Accumulibacter sp.]